MLYYDYAQHIKQIIMNGPEHYQPAFHIILINSDTKSILVDIELQLAWLISLKHINILL